MAVKIRLRRMGTNNTPFYRVVVADARQPSKGRFIEAVGWYDPQRTGVNYQLKLDRIEYWTGNGAQLSDTVRSLVQKSRTGTVPVEKSAPPAPPAPPPTAESPEPAAAEPAAPETEPGETVAETTPTDEPEAADSTETKPAAP